MGTLRDGMYTRPVTPEEQALGERIAAHVIPLCSVPNCDKLAGHEDDHGPISLYTHAEAAWCEEYLHGV